MAFGVRDCSTTMVMYELSIEGGVCGLIAAELYIAFVGSTIARICEKNNVVFGAPVNYTVQLQKSRVEFVEMSPFNLQLAPKCMMMSFSVLDSFYMLSLISSKLQVVSIDKGDRLRLPLWHDKLFRNDKGQIFWSKQFVS